MRVVWIVALLAMLGPAAPAFAQKSANLGSNPPGTAFYSVASGLSKIVTDVGVVKLTVQPYSGSSTFLNLTIWNSVARLAPSQTTADHPMKAAMTMRTVPASTGKSTRRAPWLAK